MEKTFGLVDLQPTQNVIRSDRMITLFFIFFYDTIIPHNEIRLHTIQPVHIKKPGYYSRLPEIIKEFLLFCSTLLGNCIHLGFEFCFAHAEIVMIDDVEVVIELINERRTGRNVDADDLLI